jgi:hypothetical protein
MHEGDWLTDHSPHHPPHYTPGVKIFNDHGDKHEGYYVKNARHGYAHVCVCVSVFIYTHYLSTYCNTTLHSTLTHTHTHTHTHTQLRPLRMGQRRRV